MSYPYYQYKKSSLLKNKLALKIDESAKYKSFFKSQRAEKISQEDMIDLVEEANKMIFSKLMGIWL